VSGVTSVGGKLSEPAKIPAFRTRECRAGDRSGEETDKAQVLVNSTCVALRSPGVEHSLGIGAVSERTGVAASALRYYDAEGLITSTRTDGNQRRYHRDVLRRVSFIRVAQRVGLTLEEIHDALASLPESRTPTQDDWSRISRAWRPRLDEQIHLIERLRDRLDGCIGCGCLSLKACRLLNPDDQAGEHGSGPRYLIGADDE
jgi:MerR family redox-sensitive transcriptional activator SoxR